jgi:hypothetical protein
MPVVSRCAQVYDRTMLVRRRVALPAFLGLFGLVWAAAHAVAHDVVEQAPAAGHDPGHAGSPQAYAAYVPTSLALCLVLATAIAAGAAVGKRWTGRSGPSIWLFGIVPVLGFAADTLAELLAQGPLSTAAVAELVPVFLIGLLVQIPFALIAVGLASRILWLAERLALALADGDTTGRAEPAGFARPRSAQAPAFPLAGAGRSRAPPFALEP